MKKQIKNRVFAMLLAVMFVLTSAFTMPSVEVFAKDTTTVVTASKNKVSLNYSTLTIKKGKSATLKARKSSSLKKKGLVWTSSNKKVATVDSKGKIKAIKNGKTNITVKVKGTKIKAVCKVIVGTPVTKVKANKTKATIYVGDKYTIKTKVSSKKASNKKLSYTSSNKKVAFVNSKGVVTAKKAGKAKITIKSTDGSNKKAVVTITVKTASISLNEASAVVALNTTHQLVATVSPNGVLNKKVTWASDNTAVATVDANGLVTGVGIGTATITAKNASGKTATCTVSVEAIATDPNALYAYLANPAITTITYASQNVEAFEIPAGDYTTKNLIINAPNATIVNRANFQSVTINAIAQNTYQEYGVNTVNYNAPTGHVVVGDTGVATINLATTSASVIIENNGTVSALNVTTQVNLNITGINDVPVHIAAEAANTSITTSTTLEIVASATWTMAVLPGGEGTSASVDNENCTPTVYGLGVISVYVASLNDIVNITAVMTDDLGINQTATVNGKVTKHYLEDGSYDYSNAAGANVYLIGYNAGNSGIDYNNCSSFINGVAATTVGENGKYSFSNVRYGNYWVVVQLDGYRPSVQSIEINSSTGNSGTFSNDNIDLISNELAAAPNAAEIKGKVKDGSTGSAVPAGITVKLRSGSNNITGTVLKTATIDADGYYTFTDVPAGVYTVEAVDLRTGLDANAVTYNQAYKSIVVASGYISTTSSSYGFTMNRHYVNSIISGTGQVQFTLEWGNEESGADRDLDSHLFGPKATGEADPFHVYYSNKKYTVDSEIFADLDVDDVTYEGPEHTTIYYQTAGQYRFYVHNFTRRNEDSSSVGLANSNAKVTVSIGNSVQTYYCPMGSGTVWYVGYYDSTTRTFHPVNQMGTGKMNYGDNFSQIVTGTAISPDVVQRDIQEILASEEK
ncbi:MAG: Ig-like domain-containing protein [Agathobacter sp.]|nr:Ig-like domain-containing protein [Agathobacter sp.]